MVWQLDLTHNYSMLFVYHNCLTLTDGKLGSVIMSTGSRKNVRRSKFPYLKSTQREGSNKMIDKGWKVISILIKI